MINDRGRFNQSWYDSEREGQDRDWKGLVAADVAQLNELRYDGSMDVATDLLKRIMEGAQVAYSDKTEMEIVAKAAKTAKKLTDERTKEGFANDQSMVGTISAAQRKVIGYAKEHRNVNPQRAYKLLGTVESSLSNGSELLYEVLVDMKKTASMCVEGAQTNKSSRYLDLSKRIADRQNPQYFSLLASVAADALNATESLKNRKWSVKKRITSLGSPER